MWLVFLYVITRVERLKRFLETGYKQCEKKQSWFQWSDLIDSNEPGLMEELMMILIERNHQGEYLNPQAL